MTSKSFYLIKYRQQITPRNDTEYMMLNKNIRNKCKQANDEWFNERYA